MSDRHALPDSDAIWRDTGSFLRVGSVVPISVLNFDDTGTATDHRADPSVTPPEIAAWAKQELAHIPSYEPDLSEVGSPHCSHKFFTTLPCGTKLPFYCTEMKGHTVTDHQALGEAEVQAHVSRRKPSPKPRKTSVAS